MAESQQKRPRGRPPTAAILVDGHWHLTEESLEKAAARLIQHRTDCRERYRRKRVALVTQRPDLFESKKRRSHMRLAGSMPERQAAPEIDQAAAQLIP